MGRDRAFRTVVFADVAIADDGEFVYDQCEMVLAEGSSEAVVAELSDVD